MFKWLRSGCNVRPLRCTNARIVPTHIAIARLASISSSTLVVGLFAFALAVSAQTLGRPATPAEIKAWDIDVRPDFKGLPAGSGSVKKWQDVWEAKCESCHGVFGESNEVFTPIAGGTTKADMKTGRVEAMRFDSKAMIAQRTTLMKLSELSTLWDYINRAMPWNAPKTLTTEEVYAVTAYVLHLGEIVPGDFVLSDKNIRYVQATLPNRNGKTHEHGMWSVNAKPDVQGANCTSNCAISVRITSALPDYARNAHGNLAEQNRLIGGVRGINTAGTVVTAAAELPDSAALKLAQQHACMACHGAVNKLVGPSLSDIHKKYKDSPSIVALLAAKIRAGGSGVWGAIPMPAQSHVPEGDIKAIAEWIASGKF
jgi:S-disulfanyl-L-cysteine oxidoreductase SoxD